MPAGAFRKRRMQKSSLNMPAGGFCFEYFVKGLTKYARRGLLGEIFDKLRIQCRMQIFEKLHATLDSQLIKYFPQKALAGIFSEPFYKIFPPKGPCGNI